MAFDFREMFNSTARMNSKNLKPARFKLANIDLAVLPAQPNMVFACDEDRIVVHVASTGGISVDPMIRPGISFIIQVTSDINLDPKQVNFAIADVLEHFSGGCVEDAQSELPEEGQQQYRICVVKTPDIEQSEEGDIYSFSAIASIEVMPDVIDIYTKIINTQLEILEKSK